MKLMNRLCAGVLAILLSAVFALPAMASIACGATGQVAIEPGEDYYVYTITASWDFNGAASPEAVLLNLDHLIDCPFYDPDDPIQQQYIIPETSYSDPLGECLDLTGMPTSQIEWVGGMSMEDPDCWLPTLHVYWANNGPTMECDVPTAGTAVFTFRSYGMPADDQMYYGAFIMKAGGYCVECDYFGPMPDCNTWTPVEKQSWGTIKALYR